MRLPPDGLSPAALAARLIRQTLRDAVVLVRDAVKAGGERHAGAGVTVLDQWMEAHQEREFFRAIFDQNVETIEQLLGSAEDSAHALLATLDSGRPSTAPLFVLERAIVEAILRICWLLDSDHTPERTVVRMMVVQVEQIEGSLQIAESFGPAAAGEARQIRENIADFHRMIADHGFTRTPQRRPELTGTISLGASTETARISITDAGRAHLRLTPWQYPLSSGAAHGRPWMLAAMFDRAVATPREAHAACLAITGDLLEAADALADAAHAHTGIDVARFHKAVHERRLALTTRARGNSVSVGHEEYRTRTIGTNTRAPILPATFRGHP